MVATIGFVFLVLALAACVYSISAYIFGLRTNRPQLTQSARQATLAATSLFSASVIILLIALVNHNFEIEYVAAYTSTYMTMPYLISALWAGNAGSLLFWGWIVSLSAAVVVLRRKKQGQELVPYATMIVMAVQAFFLLLLIFAQNPFVRLESVPAEGVGLNPVLENPGMIIHPPLLLIGFAVMAVPFGYAIAALLTRKLGDSDWLVAARRWALLGWITLGLGNLIGAWWAYAELGWGGYWAWDPVENAGLMPWLTVTAFLHAIMMQKRKGIFKAWSMVLIILTFTLTIFGTFITRSDILRSVHTFGETAVGPFFLVFLIISFFSSFALLIYRYKDLKSSSEVNAFASREGTFLINNLLLVGATLFILIGTILPSIVETVSDTTFTLNQSFFNRSTVPVLLAIVLLVGVCTLIAWRRQEGRRLARSLLWPTLVALLVLVVTLIFGVRQWVALVAFFLCSFSLSAILSQWLRDIHTYSRAKSLDVVSSFWRLFISNRRRYGAFIVHISIVIIATGVAGSSLFDVEEQADLMPGEQMQINDYTITYNSIVFEPGEHRMMLSAELDIYRGDTFIDKMFPKVTSHVNYEQWVSDVAIRSTLVEDLYLILG
ncbi:heme lyase CcmF/NrfE family subunit, partial [Chloroflexota bacterium]